jgi:hypothetical protein
VFPVWYVGLTYRVEHVDSVVAALAVRNLLMVALLVLAVREAVAGLRAPQRGMPLERQPPGPEGNEARVLR